MKSICVFLGSSTGRRPIYAQTVRTLAQEMVRRELTVVFGGSGVGLMAQLAETVLAAGGRVVGIIPKVLHDQGLCHKNLTKTILADDLSDRKRLMLKHSEGFIALPGGLGTLDELFEMITWNQTGYHPFPCGLLNVDGFYQPLLDQLDRAADEGFIRPEHRAIIMHSNEPSDLINQFEAYRAAPGKWVDRP